MHLAGLDGNALVSGVGIFMELAWKNTMGPHADFPGPTSEKNPFRAFLENPGALKYLSAESRGASCVLYSCRVVLNFSFDCQLGGCARQGGRKGSEVRI